MPWKVHDLVADVALRGDAVGTHDHHVDEAVLHQMAARIVRNHGIRHAVMAKLPGGERSTLVSRPRLICKNMYGQASVVRHVDWCCRWRESTVASQPALQ